MFGKQICGTLLSIRNTNGGILTTLTAGKLMENRTVGRWMCGIRVEVGIASKSGEVLFNNRKAGNDFKQRYH